MRLPRIYSFIFLLPAFLLMLVCAARTAAKEPSTLDFAYGIRMEVSGADSLYETALPLAVYRGVTRGDLRDLCVFNARGEVVPYALFRTETRTAPTEKKGLPLFPLMGDPVRKLVGLSLNVKRDDSGSIINVTTANGHLSARNVVAYLLDATRIEEPVAALELELRGQEEGILRKIAVESSSDLQHWTTIVPGAALARLRYGNHTLERMTIELGSAEARYFRLSCRDGESMPELGGVYARMAGRAVESPHQWISVPAIRKRKNGAYEYSFDTSGRMPVDRIRVHLPQENTLVKATFLSRSSSSDSWIERQSSLVYNVRLGGDTVKNPDPVFPPVSDRYWLMRVDTGGGGLGEGIPRLEFGWIPEKLVFIARGSAPFTIAYGSATAGPSGGMESELLIKLRDLRKEYTVTKIAATGPRVTLGGESRLRPGMTPQNWKTALLWSTLILGVGFIAWMAVRLYRQLQ
jgi:hypothetical protein